MRLPLFPLFALLGMLTVNTVFAGGSGFNVFVLANQNSSNSLRLANDYCELRDVPPQNILRLTNIWSGEAIYCSADEFSNQMLLPLLNAIQTRGLTNQIQFVLLSMDIPYQVVGTNGLNSTTSALFYGFKLDTNPPAGLPATCNLPANSTNSYVFSERAFVDAPPASAPTNSFLAMMLTDSNLTGAEAILNRAVQSDSTFPSQPIFLEKTGDSSRNVRFPEFDNAVFDALVHGSPSVSRISSDSTLFTNLAGLETGLANFQVYTNEFVAGSLADSLTSYGGEIFQNSGQTSLLAFLDGGASGSYGTVIEPCNYLQKFPNPLDFFYQARGFSLAEAYYQSVCNPFQGLMVGEPLAAPFAVHAAGTWTQFSGVPLLNGQTNLQFAFSAGASNLPIKRVDLFVDGSWSQTVTNIPPTLGDGISVILNGHSNHYTIPTNATVTSVASGLTSVLNAVSNTTSVRAVAIGDRIELRYLNLAASASNLTMSLNMSGNSTMLTSARTNFLDSIAIGYHVWQVVNAPSVGSWLQLVVTKTNGSTVSVAVTNTISGTTIAQLAQALYSAVNSTGSLLSTDGVYFDDLEDDGSSAQLVLYARSPGAPASAVQGNLTASSDLTIIPTGRSALRDNIVDLQSRNHLYVASGKASLPVNWTLDTTQFADGYHELDLVASDGTSVRTQTRLTQRVQVQNTSLSATLSVTSGGNPADVNSTLQFTVNANAASAIQLYGNGGLLGSSSSTSNATFSVAGITLGEGLQVFYAVVIDGAGHVYRTDLTSLRLIGTEPQFSVSITYPPITLEWSATAGRPYQILSTTNLLLPFQVIATVTPSNNIGTWVETNTNSAAYYLIQTSN